MANKLKTFFDYLTKPIPLKNNFEDYNVYWKNRGFNAPSLNRGKIISKHILKGKRILDIGCGDGTIIDYLAKNNNPAYIMGVDISNYAVNYVKKRGYNAKVINILNKDFKNFLSLNKFDYIIITEVLEHIQDPEVVIETIKKYSPQSVLFISIPNSGFVMHRLRLLLGRFPIVMINEHIKEHIRFWTYSDFKYWIKYLSYELKGNYVSTTTRFLGFDLGTFYPTLFAKQIIYEIKKL